MSENIQMGMELMDYAMKISSFCDILDQAQTLAQQAAELITSYDGRATEDVTIYHGSLSAHIARLKTFYLTGRNFIQSTDEWMHHVDAQLAQKWLEQHPDALGEGR